MPKTNTMQYVNISIFKKNTLVNLCFGNYTNTRSGDYQIGHISMLVIWRNF